MTAIYNPQRTTSRWQCSHSLAELYFFAVQCDEDWDFWPRFSRRASRAKNIASHQKKTGFLQNVRVRSNKISDFVIFHDVWLANDIQRLSAQRFSVFVSACLNSYESTAAKRFILCCRVFHRCKGSSVSGSQNLFSIENFGQVRWRKGMLTKRCSSIIVLVTISLCCYF